MAQSQPTAVSPIAAKAKNKYWSQYHFENLWDSSIKQTKEITHAIQETPV